jgi:Kef-type K+ transport system membrane component KefB
LQEPESQIILGAAVIDDVVGLIILAVVSRLTAGQTVSVLNVAWITLSAFGFLALALLLGRLVVPPLVRWSSRIDLPGTPTMVGLMIALGLAWLASAAGSALIIGAFAAGLLLRETSQAKAIETGVAHIGHFFVPIFFVSVGAAVDVRVLNPLDPANRPTLLVSAVLLVAAVVGKFLAGYAPLRFRGNKNVIGVGMIPRGEVGLIFAQMGLNGKVFDAALFSGVTLVVMATTFMAPPLLKMLFPPLAQKPSPPDSDESDGIENLVSTP